MVGETARSSYRKKKKGKLFSGTQRHAAKGKKPTPADDFETKPSTSLVANQSNSDSEKPWIINNPWKNPLVHQGRKWKIRAKSFP